MRFVRAPDGTVAFDVAAALPTRGAWTVPSREAIATAIDRGGFARAFGAPILADAAALADEVDRVLQQEVLRALGLLRRQSGLIVGRSECLEQAAAGRKGQWVLAADLAERSLGDLGDAPGGALRGPNMEAIGQALGRGPVGVLLVTGPGALRRRLVTDLSRWGRLQGLVSPLTEAPPVAAPDSPEQEVHA